MGRLLLPIYAPVVGVGNLLERRLARSPGLWHHRAGNLEQMRSTRQTWLGLWPRSRKAGHEALPSSGHPRLLEHRSWLPDPVRH